LAGVFQVSKYNAHGLDTSVELVSSAEVLPLPGVTVCSQFYDLAQIDNGSVCSDPR
jgi:hypothetical protein